MTIKEALQEFGKEYGEMKEKILFKHLCAKYAKEFFKEHASEFRDECFSAAEELYKKYPAEVKTFMNSPMFNADGSINKSVDMEATLPLL